MVDDKFNELSDKFNKKFDKPMEMLTTIINAGKDLVIDNTDHIKSELSHGSGALEKYLTGFIEFS